MAGRGEEVVLEVRGDGGRWTPKIVGYYAGWATHHGRDLALIDGSKLTHVVYAFADIGRDLRIALGDPEADTQKLFPGDTDDQAFHGNFGQLVKLKARYPHLRTSIAVGGWSWSGRFSDVAATAEGRRAFAESCGEFVARYGFDGVDIDWEFPVSGGKPENSRRPEDKQNYTLLMQALREQLDAQAARDGKGYELTFAGSAGAWFLDKIELDRLHPLVDHIHLMTYDLHGPWDKMTGLTAPLYSDPRNGPYWSVADAVRLYLSRGVPKEKLVMGVPFYGYRYDGVVGGVAGNRAVGRAADSARGGSEARLAAAAGTTTLVNANTGLYQPFEKGASVSYATIRKERLENGCTRFWHPVAQVPMLYNGSMFISHEDPESIWHKAAFVREAGLGGAMIWELSLDTPDGELLDSLYEGLVR